MKGKSLLLDTSSGWWAMLPSLWSLRSKWPTPFEKRRFRQISTYNVSTVRGSENSSIMTNIKSTTGFPTSYRWSAYVTPMVIKQFVWLPLSQLKGGSKSDVFVFLSKSQFAGECHKDLMVGGNVDHIHRRDLYSAARPNRTNCLITIWCRSVSGSGDSCGNP